MSLRRARMMTTHVGSLARPKALLDGMRKQQVGEDSPAAELAGMVRHAVHDVVRRQVEAGIDIVTDGEMGKVGFFTYIGDRLAGLTPASSMIEPTRPASWQQEVEAFPEYYEEYFQRYFSGNVARTRGLVCTGPVSYQGQAAVAADIANLKDALTDTSATDAFLCATVPRPFAPNEHYESDDEYQYAIADAVREEYNAIIDSGLMLQVDDPVLIDLLSGNGGTDVEDRRVAAERHVEIVNYALRGLPPERLRLHTCYGINHGPRISDLPFSEVAPLMLKINVGAYSFEAGNPRHLHEWQVWESIKLPEDKTLIPGLIGHAVNYVEHPELIAQYIRKYADLVGPENVIAGTDCGFSSQATYRPEVHPDVVWEKFRALSAGAALATRELSVSGAM